MMLSKSHLKGMTNKHVGTEPNADANVAHQREMIEHLLHLAIDIIKFLLDLADTPVQRAAPLWDTRSPLAEVLRPLLDLARSRGRCRSWRVFHH